MYRLTLYCPQKHFSEKWNIPPIWQGNNVRKISLYVCMSNFPQGYCNLQLSFAMNLPCKFELSLISLLPSLPELLRFTSLFNLLVGPDPPFCKLIIQVNVCYFHRNYDVVQVLQMNKWKNEFCCIRKKIFKSFQNSKTLQKEWHCYTILFGKIAVVILVLSWVNKLV